MADKTLREHSQIHYTSLTKTLEDINTGSLQRIADAVEKMAANYDDMKKSRDWWKDYANDLVARTQKQSKTIRALRGHNTRLKTQVKQCTSSLEDNKPADQ